MKAVLNFDGTLESVKIAEFPKPTLQNDHDVLVQVKAVGLNPVDYKVIPSSDFGPLPKVVGFDCAGIVAEVGPQVKDFKPGDRVYFHGALNRNGVFAEYTVIQSHVLAPIKDGFDFDLAAAIPCAGYTAQQLLKYRLPSLNGSNIFIQGASGGVGSFAILVAKKKGFKIYASASSKNHEYLKNLGADVVFSYQDGELLNLKKHLQNEPLDVAILSQPFDDVYMTSLYQMMNFGSAIFPLLGLVNIPTPPFMKSLTFSSASLGGGYVSKSFNGEKSLGDMGRDLMELLTPSEVAPIVSKRLSFDEIPDALRQFKAGTLGHYGKVVALLE